jgi:O-antigen ligase
MLGLVRRHWPAWLVAFSLNGFYLYLAALDVLDVEPRTPLTAAYYGALATGLLATAWHRRDAIARHLRAGRRLAVACLASGAALAAWFVLNTALLSDGRLAWRLAGLLVLWTVPTAILALSLRPSDLTGVALGLIGLGLLFVPIETVAAARAGDDVFRFTPIADLDVISAGTVPAIGAVAALSLRPSSAYARLLQLATIAVLSAATVLPGSRGPVLALVLGVLATALVRRSLLDVASLACVALGLVCGSVAASHLGSFDYLTSNELTTNEGAGEGRVISTLSIRRQWTEDALRATPERPIFGHGVGMFEDNTPEARLMGVEGQRTYPHNSLVEAAYSLGALGLVAYVAFVGSAAAAAVAVSRRRPRGDQAVALMLGLGAFALAQTSISGEIGEDAVLWTAAALAVVLYVESGSAPETAQTEPLSSSADEH